MNIQNNKGFKKIEVDRATFINALPDTYEISTKPQNTIPNINQSEIEQILNNKELLEKSYTNILLRLNNFQVTFLDQIAKEENNTNRQTNRQSIIRGALDEIIESNIKKHQSSITEKLLKIELKLNNEIFKKLKILSISQDIPIDEVIKKLIIENI